MRESSLSCLYRRPILTVSYYSCFASEDNFCTLYEVEDGEKRNWSLCLVIVTAISFETYCH